LQPYLNLRVGDPVQFLWSTAKPAALVLVPCLLASLLQPPISSLPTPLPPACWRYPLPLVAPVDITDDGTAVAPNEFQVAYAEYAAVGQVQSWSFEISRAEIDVTTIGQTVGQYAPFRAYIPGFADGSGTATVYVTNEDAALSNRMVEDVLQRQQVGCGFKLYTDKQGTEALSRSIAMDAVLLSASLNINPDDAQQVEITFRPSGAPTFDFSTTV
jgi:hypothetical protein